MPASNDQLLTFRERGYLIADDAVAPERVDQLEIATRRALAAKAENLKADDARELGEAINPALGDQINIRFARGQTLFWNGSLFHRGRAPDAMPERITLHAGLIKHEEGDVPEDWESQFTWRFEKGVRERLSGQMQVWFDRWRELQPQTQQADPDRCPGR